MKFDNTRIESMNIEARRYNDQGMQFSRENNPEEAIRAFTESITLSPNASAFNNRCVEYNRKGLYDLAETDASKAIYLSPKFAAAYFNRGNTYFRKNEHDRASRDYLRAIELDPNQAEFYFNCGLAYHKLGHDESTIEMYRKAVEVDSRYFQAYYNLACLFSIKNDGKGALAYLEKAAAAGFTDANRMKKEPALSVIRNTIQFRVLLQKMERRATVPQ